MNLRARKDKYHAIETERKARKALRQRRAKIHAAIEQAIAMKRSKRKGTANLDVNLKALGYTRVRENGDGIAVEHKFKGGSR